MFKCIGTPFSSEKPYNCATFRTEEDKGNRPNLLLQFKISMCKGNMRPVPTKWETLQVTKIHFQDMIRFKMVYYMSWLLPYLRSKTIFTLSNSFVFYWFLKCSMSHTSFSSLATCRSFCDNRSHMLLFKSKNKHIKKTFHCCRRHNLPFLSTIIPSTSPQLSTDIRALWSTDALVYYYHKVIPQSCQSGSKPSPWAPQSLFLA